jgi:hypothetical protein
MKPTRGEDASVMIATHSPASAVANTISSSRSRHTGDSSASEVDEGERLGEQSNRAPHVHSALMEFARHSVERRPRRNHDVMADAVL